MFSPSENDKLATVGTIQSSLDLGQRELENLKQKAEYSGDNTTKEKYDAANLRREEFANQKLALQGSDTQFGTVFAASGFRKTSTGLALDWALILPPGNRIGKNLVSPRRCLSTSAAGRLTQVIAARRVGVRCRCERQHNQ